MSQPSISPPILSILFLVALFLGSCELLGDTSSPDYGTITDISYTRHVQVLFADRCQSCHDGREGGLSLKSWATMTAGSASGGPVIPFEPDRSRLMRMLTDLPGGPHPAELGEETVTPDELEFLRRWIAQGARNDQNVVPYSNLTRRVLVAVEDRALIAVVDPDQMAIARTIDLEALGFSPNSAPSAFAHDPADNGWFVSLRGEGLILSFGPDDVLRGLVEVDAPAQLAASGDEGWLLAGGSDVGQQGSVQVIRTPAMAAQTRTLAFPGTEAVALRPQGDIGYAVSFSADQLGAFPPSGGQATWVAIPGPNHRVGQMVVSRAGDLLVAAGSLSGQALLFSLATPSTPIFQGMISMGAGLRSPVLSGGALFGLAGSGRIVSAPLTAGSSAATIIDLLEASSLVDAGGLLVAPNPNDSRSVVPSQRFSSATRVGWVAIVDPALRSLLRRIELDGRPVAALALTSQ